MAMVILKKAKKNKTDEFYEKFAMIEQELKYYNSEFFGKTIFCKCDTPFECTFFIYFAMNFNYLGLKKLICISHDISPIIYKQLSFLDEAKMTKKGTLNKKHAVYKIEITEIKNYNDNGEVDVFDVEQLLKNNTPSIFQDDGNFRSAECIELLKESDIIVTHPPFSLFREYVNQVVEHDKKFLIISNKTPLLEKSLFPILYFM